MNGLHRVCFVLVGDPKPGTKAAEVLEADREIEKLLMMEDGEVAAHSPRRFRWGLMGVEDLLVMPILVFPSERDAAEATYRRLGWQRVVFIGPMAAENLREKLFPEERVEDAGKAPA